MQLLTIEKGKLEPAQLRWQQHVLPVENIDEDYSNEVVIQMLEIMAENDGLGLAANQVGAPLRIFVTNNIVALNPTIINPQYYKDVTEGCLSIPGKTDIIGRATKLMLQYYDLVSREWKERNCIGEEAHVVQHEVDHLNGVLYTDYGGLATGRQQRST